MVGIYHKKDLDGICSGAILKYKYPNIKLVGFDYGEKIDYSKLDDETIMVDVSLSIEEMVELSKVTKLTWIDHHISIIKDYKKYVEVNGDFCNAVLDISRSACESTWLYMFPGKDMPKSVSLLGMYDTFKNTDKLYWENYILPFQYGMRGRSNSIQTFSEEFFWNDDLIPMVIEEGISILKYNKKQDEMVMEQMSFESNFYGYRALCLNAGFSNSLRFESLYDESKHDIMLAFCVAQEGWRFTMYTTKDTVDCSEICKLFGGGGHKKASGFGAKQIKITNSNIVIKDKRLVRWIKNLFSKRLKY